VPETLAEQGARRPRADEPRSKQVTVKLTVAEHARLLAAAGRAELALGAYLGQVGMDAAEHRAMPVATQRRELLLTLMELAGLVRRAGGNLNQAVARLNSTGIPGPDLEPSAKYCMRVVAKVDEAAELVRRGQR